MSPGVPMASPHRTPTLSLYVHLTPASTAAGGPHPVTTMARAPAQWTQALLLPLEHPWSPCFWRLTRETDGTSNGNCNTASRPRSQTQS